MVITSGPSPREREKRHNLPPRISPNTTINKLPFKLDKNTNSLPFPITFIQTDPNSFKQVVQRLTGPSKQPITDQIRSNYNNIPLVKTKNMKLSTTSTKLYERRNKNGLLVSPFVPYLGTTLPGYWPKSNEFSSPSLVNLPSLSLSISPVTPLVDNPFGESTDDTPSSSERGERERRSLSCWSSFR